MSNFITLNNKYFFKGIFYWFGIEDNPALEKAQKSVYSSPQKAIKNDLNKIRKNYKKSFTRLKKEVQLFEQ